jgi:hypothetical protein
MDLIKSTQDLSKSTYTNHIDCILVTAPLQAQGVIGVQSPLTSLEKKHTAFSGVALSVAVRHAVAEFCWAELKTV